MSDKENLILNVISYTQISTFSLRKSLEIIKYQIFEDVHRAKYKNVFIMKVEYKKSPYFRKYQTLLIVP